MTLGDRGSVSIHAPWKAGADDEVRGSAESIFAYTCVGIPVPFIKPIPMSTAANELGISVTSIVTVISMVFAAEHEIISFWSRILKNSQPGVSNAS